MKKRTTNIFGLLAIALMLGGSVFGQVNQNITVNQGGLYIKPNTLISTHFDFDNTTSGIVFNDGEFQFYKNYNNDGLFTHTNNKKTGYTVFQGNQLQLISGSQPSKHFDVLFHNTSTQYPFDLNSDMIINGTGNFINGIIKINKDLDGKLLFGNGATQINASDKSYAEGMVEKQGNNSFVFPIGKSGYYRKAGISAPSHEKHLYFAEYFLEETNNKYPNKDRAGIIESVDNNEYWSIERINGTSGSVIVTLSWNDNTTPVEFRGTDNLHIVRWDSEKNIWVDEGGIMDLVNQTVTTPVKVEGFGIFTLGKIKSNYLNPGEVVIYQGVTPDGDGLNDYFIIDNIEYFPTNNVTVFNRWGRKVYETTAYNTKGNVFKGVVEGVSGASGEKLPTGTYYYVVEYLYDHDDNNYWVKKVGHLHLENNN